MRRIAPATVFQTTVLVALVIISALTAGAADSAHRAQPAGFAYWTTDASGRPMSFTVPTSPDNWLGGSGNWSNGALWSAGEPGGASDVFINTGNDSVMLDVSTSINSLTLGGSSGSSNLSDTSHGFHSITIAGALTINQSGNLSLANGDTISAGATSSNAGGIGLNGSMMTVTGDFTNSGNIALIEGGTAANINVSGNFNNTGNFMDVSAIDGLSVGGTLTNSGFLSIAQLSVTGAINNTGTLQLIEIPDSPHGFVSPANAASLTNSGTIDVGNSFQVSGNATNSGHIDIFALGFSADLDVGGTLTNMSAGQISVANDSSLIATNLVNSGNIQVGQFGQVEVFGNLTNSGAINANGQASAIVVDGRFTNNSGGTLGLTSNAAASIANMINAGSVIVGNGATLNVPPPSHAVGNALGGFVNSGTVAILSGGSISSPAQYLQTAGQTTVDGQLSGVVNFAGGSVYGNAGTISGNITSNASINIGDAPMTVGTLMFNGNYTQRANGSLTFDIASLTQYDQLNVSGHAQLNGLMTVDLLHGYIPQVGNMFDIMNFAGESGTFSTVIGLPINSQEHFVLQYNATNLTLDVVAGPGMQASSGHGSSSSNEPFVSLVTAETGLQSNSDVPSETTPEPGSIVLLGSGVAALAGWLKRRGII
jgi:hypothetical protein